MGGGAQEKLVGIDSHRLTVSLEEQDFNPDHPGAPRNQNEP